MSPLLRIEIEGGEEMPVVDGSALGWALEVQMAGLRLAPLMGMPGTAEEDGNDAGFEEDEEDEGVDESEEASGWGGEFEPVSRRG